MTSDGAAAKKSAGGTSFDRIKPANTAEPKAGPVVDARVDDVQGKRALFSGADQPPAIGSVALDCTRCDRRSVVSYVRLLKLMTTGFFVPMPIIGQRAWVKCPACRHHAWANVSRD